MHCRPAPVSRLFLLRHVHSTLQNCRVFPLSVLLFCRNACFELYREVDPRATCYLRRIELAHYGQSSRTALHDVGYRLRRKRSHRHDRCVHGFVCTSLPRGLVYVHGIGVPYHARPVMVSEHNRNRDKCCENVDLPPDSGSLSHGGKFPSCHCPASPHASIVY